MKSLSAQIFVVLAVLLAGCSGDDSSGGGGGGKTASTPTDNTDLNSCEQYRYSSRHQGYVDNNGEYVRCRSPHRQRYNSYYGRRHCINYIYHPRKEHWRNAQNNRADCRRGRFFDFQRIYPYYTTRGDGCHYWNQNRNGRYYRVPVGRRYVCVSAYYLQAYGNFSGFNTGGFVGCRYGYNCSQQCREGSFSLGGLFGGTYRLCRSSY